MQKDTNVYASIEEFFRENRKVEGLLMVQGLSEFANSLTTLLDNKKEELGLPVNEAESDSKKKKYTSFASDTHKESTIRQIVLLARYHITMDEMNLTQRMEWRDAGLEAHCHAQSLKEFAENNPLLCEFDFEPANAEEVLALCDAVLHQTTSEYGFELDY